MGFIPGLRELQIQERGNGEWLVGSGSRHVIAGREMLSIIKSLADAGDYQSAYSRYVEDGGLLAYEQFSVQATRCRAVFDASDAGRDKAVKLRADLFQPTFVRKVSQFLHFLFRWPGAAFGIAAAMVAIGFVVAGFRWSEVVACSISSISAPQLLLGFVVVLVGGLIHELGHAAALARFQQTPGAIGFGLYAGFLPVFFADLSYSWRLRTRQRVVVSLGGIYLQLIFSSLVIGISSIWKSDFLLAAGLSSAVLAVFQLIPVARSDGFWILADLLGEPRLARYQTSLWQDSRKRSAAGRSARVRLAYQAINLLFVAALLLAAFSRAKTFGSDLLAFVLTGMTTESLNSPAMFLAFLIFCLLFVRILGSLSRPIIHAISKR
jgi:putative peptide zinc metalloprotease protein